MSEFLVKWKGYSHDERTWEPIANLDNAQEALDEWRAKSHIDLDDIDHHGQDKDDGDRREGDDRHEDRQGSDDRQEPCRTSSRLAARKA
jgi:hypothetical protein